jgi:hypothetical protein
MQPFARCRQRPRNRQHQARGRPAAVIAATWRGWRRCLISASCGSSSVTSWQRRSGGTGARWVGGWVGGLSPLHAGALWCYCFVPGAVQQGEKKTGPTLPHHKQPPSNRCQPIKQPTYDMHKAWDARARRFYADRYDSRSNMVDFDYHMRLAVRGTPGLDPGLGSIIHFTHYRCDPLAAAAFTAAAPERAHSSPNFCAFRHQMPPHTTTHTNQQTHACHQTYRPQGTGASQEWPTSCGAAARTRRPTPAC